MVKLEESRSNLESKLSSKYNPKYVFPSLSDGNAVDLLLKIQSKKYPIYILLLVLAEAKSCSHTLLFKSNKISDLF